MEMVDKMRQVRLASGHEDSIGEVPAGTHRATYAAAAAGCCVAPVAKSIGFRAGDNVVLVIASGAHRIDTNKVSSARANEFAVDSFVVDTVHTANPADCRLQ